MQLGKYEVVKKIGEGSMGKVYLATMPGTSTYFAIKILVPGKGYETRYHRFQREIRSLSMLDHPHIVHIYDSGKIKDVPYLVMEFLDGISLSELLASQENKLSLLQSTRIVDQILSALDYLHERSIIHRDLKPSNIMITTEGMVKLTDFGLVKMLDSDESMMTETGAIIGTVKYMSPEQALGKKVDARTDIYSLGIIFYVLATGQLPFVAEDPISMLWKIIQDVPTPPTSINPAIPPDLENLILKMIAKKPDERPPTAQAAMKELFKITTQMQLECPELDTSSFTTSGRNITAPWADHESTETVHYCFEPEYIDRNGEVQNLLEKIRSSQKTAVMLAISGEEGVGKTRCAREVAQRIREDFQIVFASPDPVLQGPMPVISDALRKLLCHAGHTSSFHGPLPPHEVIAAFDENCRLVIENLSTLQDSSVIPGLDYRQIASKRFFFVWETIVAMFKAVTEKRPLLLVCEDMQFSTVHDLRFLRYLVLAMNSWNTNPHNVPRICLLLTIKEEEFLEGSHITRFIDRFKLDCDVHIEYLKPLHREQTEAFICSLLSCHRGPVQLFDEIHKLSLGNPFFTECIIKDMIHRKLFLRNNDEIALVHETSQESTIDIISQRVTLDSFYEVICRHLQEFDPLMVTVIKIASIIGLRFDFQVLLILTGKPERMICDALQRLMHLGYVVEDTFAEQRYAFRHPLLHEIVYTSIDFDERKIIHYRLAEWYAGQEATATGHHHIIPWPAVTADHFVQGGDLYQAVYFYQRAGDALMRDFGGIGAAECYDLAIESLQRYLKSDSWGDERTRLLKLQFDLQEKRALLDFACGQLDPFRKQVAGLTFHARSLDNDELRLRATLRTGQLLCRNGQSEEALATLTEGLQLATALQKKEILREARECLHHVYLQSGKAELAMTNLSEMLALQNQMPPDRLYFCHLMVLCADVQMKMNNVLDAIQYYRRALSMLNDKRFLACKPHVLRATSLAARQLGRDEDAQALLLEASKAAEDMGDQYETTEMISFRLSLETAAGDTAAVEQSRKQLKERSWILNGDDLLFPRYLCSDMQENK